MLTETKTVQGSNQYRIATPQLHRLRRSLLSSFPDLDTYWFFSIGFLEGAETRGIGREKGKKKKKNSAI